MQLFLRPPQVGISIAADVQESAEVGDVLVVYIHTQTSEHAHEVLLRVLAVESRAYETAPVSTGGLLLPDTLRVPSRFVTEVRRAGGDAA